MDIVQLNALVFSKLNGSVSRILSGKYWMLKGSIICFLFTFAITLSDVLAVNEDDSSSYFQQQINHPLTPIPVEDLTTHEAKMTFRLTMPVIGHIFHMKITHLLYLQQLLLLLFYYAVILFCFRYTGSRLASLFFALSLGACYVAQSFIFEFYGLFDGIAYLLLCLCIVFDAPVLIFLFMTLAAWTDERTIISSAYLFLFYLFFSKEDTLKQNSYKSLGIVLAILFYTIVRLYITSRFGLVPTLAGVGLQAAKENWQVLALGVFTAMESLWFLLAVFLLLLLKESKSRFFLLSGLLMMSVFSSMLVHDITRSVAFIAPIILIMIKYLSQSNSKSVMEYLALAVFLMNLIIPSYFISGTNVWFISPVFPKYWIWYQ